MHDTNPYSSPNSSTADGEKPNSFSVIVSVVTWTLWTLLAMMILMLYMFAFKSDEGRNHWALNMVGVASIAIFLSIALFFGVFLFRKLSNPWLRLLVYGLGLVGVLMLMSCGFFAVTCGDYTLIISGLIGLFLHCPLINRKANRVRLSD